MLGEKGSKGEEGQVKISDVDTGRLSGLKYKLICCFKLAADMARGGIHVYRHESGRCRIVPLFLTFFYHFTFLGFLLY